MWSHRFTIVTLLLSKLTPKPKVALLMMGEQRAKTSWLEQISTIQIISQQINSAEKFTLESELLDMSVTDFDSFYNIVNSHMPLFFNCQSLSPVSTPSINISSISNLKDERATKNLEIMMNPKIN